MCGITVLISRNQEIDIDLFKEATGELSSRGPDDEGFYFERNVALGHRRLSIIDLNSGHQPISNEDDSIYVIFNGEIYDYRELHSDLIKKGHKFKTQSDTEVLLHLYEEKSYKLSEYIEGMFAFIVYDKNKNTITLSRDQFGKKPLYYYTDSDIFVAASELKSLLIFPKIKKELELDHLSLIKYMFYGYVPSPHTIFKKIHKLEPSNTLQFSIDKWTVQNKYQYWNLSKIELASNALSDMKIVSDLDKLITLAIKKRLVSDVPVGAFLSGGIDSSLVCAKTKVMKEDLQTFTISYEDKELNEAPYAQLVVDHINANGNFCVFRDDDVRRTFVEVLDYMDEPIADAAIIPTYFLSKFAKKYVKVVLSGDGGDELFAGYPKYNAQSTIGSAFDCFPKMLTKWISTGMVGLFNFPYLKNMKNSNLYTKLFAVLPLDFPIRNFIWGSGGFVPEELSKLMNNESFDMNLIFSDAIAYDNNFCQHDSINRALFLDCCIQLPDWYLVKTDRATMSNSLEMRNPLLDKKLAEYIFTIPGNRKIKNNINKYLLKKLSSNYLPAEVVNRSKRGFGVPLARWMRTVLKDLIEEILNYRCVGEYFDKKYVTSMWQEHLELKRDNSLKLFRIINFAYFINKYNIIKK